MKKLLLKFIDKYKSFLTRYPLTNIWCVIGAILVCLCYKDILEEDFIIFIITLLNCLIFVETFISKIKIKIIPTIISIVFAILAYQYIPDNNILTMIYIGIMMILIVFSIGKIIKDKDYRLDKYIYKTFVNYIPLCIIQSILMVGVLFAGLLLDELVFTDMGFDITMILEILLSFGLLIPIYLYVLTEVPTINSTIIDKIITYVLIPVCMGINLVMIIYIGKCLFTWSLPDIDVFMIILLIYMSTYLSVLLSNNIENKNKLLVFNNKYMLIFLSINILMQLYSLIVRISYYGITLPRMICAYLIILEIITIVIYYIKNNKYINKIIDISFIIIILACIVPFINVYEAPLYYHGNRVINYIEGKKIDKKDAISSYHYIKDNMYGKNFNEKYTHGMSMNEINKAICKNKYDCEFQYYGYDNNIFNYGNEYNLNMDISNYTRIKHVDLSITEFELKELKETKIDSYVVNLYDLCDGLIEFNKDNDKDKYFNNNKEIVMNDNRLFVIERFVFDYNKDDDKDNYLDISGYVLEK